MGLFDKIMGDSSENEQEEDTKPQFKSMIVESDNIPIEMKSIAVANDLSISQLDFKIIKVKTSYLERKDEGWQSADSTIIRKFKDKEFILNRKLKIKQIYKVDIYLKEDEDEHLLPSIILGANKDLTKVVATIKKDINVKYFSRIEAKLTEEINKRKIKAGILVGFLDDRVLKEIKTIVSDLRINGTMGDDSEFVVCQGFDPTLPINDKFIYHYKKQLANEDENGRVDYSKRGFVLAVSQGDCIMEYIKPKYGEPGRNCQGRFLTVKAPKEDSEVPINHTENILKKEDEEKIKYIAHKNGYVSEEGATFDIQENMEVGEVSFKTTGSIETDMDSNVKINITEADVFKDAIGPGMSVQTHELNIQGNVASGAKIKVENLTIDGQTHKTATLEAKKAEITIHRGTITAEEVTIERLEGGTVIGDIINIKQAIGGEIIGKEITIEELGSNVSIISSDTIEIKELMGSNNKFLIDPSLTKEFGESIEKINKEIKDLKLRLKPLPKLLESRKKVIAKTKPAVNMVKEKMMDLKKDGLKPPATLFAKLREFQNSVNEYNETLQKLKDDKQRIIDLKEELNKVQMKVFSAKIINHSPWKEFNEIKFKLVAPAVEQVYNTKEHEIIREISLVETHEGEYEIKRSAEYSS